MPPKANLVGDAGLVFKTGCAQELAKHLELLLNNAEVSEAYGRKALERAAGEFNWDRIADEWAGVYDELCKE